LLTGAGPGFCSGGDLTGGNTDGAVYAANEVVQTITALPTPVVAGVRGAAAGFGCPLALSCDLVIAEQSAYFQLAFTKVGLMPDGGASALLPATIGRARAARMALLAEKIPAATAFDWGMISHVVDDTAYDSELEAVLLALADGPTASYDWIKRALATVTLSALPAAQAMEAEGQLELTRTDYFRRRVREFRARRRPK
jgi:enoyl-CoA hydratase